MQNKKNATKAAKCRCWENVDFTLMALSSPGCHTPKNSSSNSTSENQTETILREYSKHTLVQKWPLNPWTVLFCNLWLFRIVWKCNFWSKYQNHLQFFSGCICDSKKAIRNHQKFIKNCLGNFHRNLTSFFHTSIYLFVYLLYQGQCTLITEQINASVLARLFVCSPLGHTGINNEKNQRHTVWLILKHHFSCVL